MYQVFFFLLLAIEKGENYQHERWLEKGFDIQELGDKITHKRDVKKAANGLFYNDGPYVSHDNLINQVPSVIHATPQQSSYETVTTKQSANPYTYSVTAMSVTPASSYHAPPTPVPKYAYQSSSIPLKSKDYGLVTPSSNINPYTYAVTASTVTPAGPYHGSPSPSSPVNYRSLPTPTYSPSNFPNYHFTPKPYQKPLTYTPKPDLTKHYGNTPTPIYQSTPAPKYQQGPLDTILLSNQGPYHHQPVRQAPADSFSIESQINDFVNSPNQHNSFQFTPQNAPAINTFSSFNTKHALTFEDEQTPSLPSKTQQQNLRNDFVPLFDQESKQPGVNHFEFSSEQLLTQSNELPQFSPQLNIDQQNIQQDFKLVDKQFNGENNQFEFPQSTFQTQFLTQENLPQQGSASAFPQSQLTQQQNLIVTPQPIFSPQSSRFNPEQFGLLDSNKSNQRTPKLFVSNNQRVQEEQQGNFEQEKDSNNIINQGEQTLFQSINQQAKERPALWTMAGASNKKHMNKEDALRQLMKIAGDDWDADIGIEQNLISDQSNFQCPVAEGHFPDPDKCSVYYQCVGGNSRRNDCQPGLKYNILTNQCDWEANVDCSLNKGQALV